MDLKELIFSLSGSASIGHHTEALDIAEEFLSSFSNITRGENSIIAQIDKGANTSLILDAHIDEVGFIIKAVDKKGFLIAAPVGSVDGRILPAIPVQVLTDSGKISGIFTSIPPHLAKDEAVPSLDNCYIDVGQNAALVSIGDFAVYDTNPLMLKNNRITSKSLDDRAGVAAVLWAAKKIAEANCNKNVTVVISGGEELGLRGAKTAVFELDVDMSISVDVSFGDCPDIPSHKTAKLGSGTMIGISPILSRDIYKRLEKTAKDNGIPYTLEVMGGTTSTNADVISLTRGGIPSALLSIPLRNMHTPCEVVDLKDIEATSNLIYEFVKGEN